MSEEISNTGILKQIKKPRDFILMDEKLQHGYKIDLRETVIRCHGGYSGEMRSQ